MGRDPLYKEKCVLKALTVSKLGHFVMVPNQKRIEKSKEILAQYMFHRFGTEPNLVLLLLFGHFDTIVLGLKFA